METEQQQIQSLLERIHDHYGYDLRQYAVDLAHRRVLRHICLGHFTSIADLQDQVLKNREVADALLRDFSINVTEMFRDPKFYHALRERVIPHLRELDHIKIWHAGCASGEEVYSMAILLKEEDLYARSVIYGTDFNHQVLEKAKQGIVPIKNMRQYIHNYMAAGGKQDFADYYRANYGHAVLSRELRRNIRFSYHNLTKDKSFGEMHLVVCRNVLIYFSRKLQERVLQLFFNSLLPGGFLCLGSHEQLRWNGGESYFELIDGEHRIYRRRTEIK